MLKVMRSRFKSLKFILWLVIFVFVAWGIGIGMDMQQGDEETAKYAATLGDDIKVPSSDFLRQYRDTEERYRQQFQDQWNPSMAAQFDLPNQVLNSLVHRGVLLEKARAMGLSATDTEVRERILRDFSDASGKFVGRPAYERFVRSRGTTPAQFEELVRDDLVVGKFRGLVKEAVLVTDGAVEEEYRKRNEKAKIEYLLLPSTKYMDASTADTATLQQYFQAKSEKYKVSEKRRVKYLLVETAKLGSELETNDAELREYYASHPEEFASPEQVTASHVLIKIAKDASPADELRTQQRANEVYAKATAPGADFAALALEYSQDEGSKLRGGDLGTFGRGQMVKAFEDEAFALAPGAVGKPVKSEFGYHVIKVMAHQPAGTQPFEQAAPQITQKLKAPRVKEAAAERAAALAKQIETETIVTDDRLRGLAKGAVSFNETPLFAAGEFIAGVGRAGSDFSKAAFALETGKVSGVVETNRGPAILKLEEVRPAGLPAYDEVKDKVALDYRREQAEKQALAALQGLATKVKAGATLAAVAAEIGEKVTTTAEFARGAAIEGLGVNRDIESLVFATEAGAVAGPVVATQGAILLRVLEKKGFDAADYDKQKEEIRQNLKLTETSRVLESLVAQAKTRDALYINQKLLDSFKPKT